MEIWKKSVGHFEVSNLGRVRSITRKVRCGRWGYTTYRTAPGKILKHQISANGYPRLSLSMGRSGKKLYVTVHSLVARAFIGPARGLQVNHKDLNKKNNHAENLEYMTAKQNSCHASEALRYSHGTRNVNAKLNEDSVLSIRREYAKGGVSQDSLAVRFGVTQINISCIVRKKTWAWV